MSVSIKQLRDNQNNFIYPKIAKEGLVEPINSNDVGISAINGIQSSTVQGALNELAGNNVEIVKTVSGNVISVSDSADYRLLGLKLYGKSVQDGVPTPESPVEIESVGDGGNITTQVRGTNLLYFPDSNVVHNGITFETSGGIVKISGTSTAESNIRSNLSISTGTYYVSGNVSGVIFRVVYRYSSDDDYTYCNAPSSFTLTGTPYEIFAQILVLAGNTVNATIYPMVNAGSTSIPWEPYKSQTLTYPTPNGLPGIPVESGGNYTDAKGQQWICDEVDFGRRKHVQRITKFTLSGDINFSLNDADTNQSYSQWTTDISSLMILLNRTAIICDQLPAGEQITPSTDNSQIWLFANSSSSVATALVVILDNTLATTTSAVKEWFSRNPATVYMCLNNPVETDLTREQLQAYAALTTYNPNTTITTDSSPAAGVEVKYLTDSGVSEVLDYYASKDDLADKQDKLSGTAGQFVGFDAEGEAEAQEITAADVGAMPTVDGGTTGQYLRKTADGQAWQDGPDLSGYATTADVAETYAPKALKFTGTFTAAGWTQETAVGDPGATSVRYSQTINVSGLTADDEPIIDLNSTATDADTFNGQLEAFGLVSNFTTGAGTLTAVVLGDSAPTVDIPIHGVVVY